MTDTWAKPLVDWPQRLRYLADNRLPTVLIDRLVSDRFDHIGVENRQATSVLVHHLLELGLASLVADLRDAADEFEQLHDSFKAMCDFIKDQSR